MGEGVTSDREGLEIAGGKTSDPMKECWRNLSLEGRERRVFPLETTRVPTGRRPTSGRGDDTVGENLVSRYDECRVDYKKERARPTTHSETALV